MLPKALLDCLFEQTGKFRRYFPDLFDASRIAPEFPPGEIVIRLIHRDT
jgi:hypothetical protein